MRRLFGPRFDLADLLVTGVALNLFLTGVSGLLPAWASIAMAIALVVLMLGLGAVTERRDRARRRIGEPADPEAPRRGLVLTLGVRSAEPGSVALRTIQRLRPQYVALLGTEATERERISERIAAQLALVDVRTETVSPVDIVDCRRGASLVIQWLLGHGLARHEILVDITAGTVVMSLGAFLSSEELRVDTQYEASSFDDRRGLRVPGSERPIYVARYSGLQGPEPSA